VTELPTELKDREMTVEHVSIPLYAGNFAWRLEYKVLPENKVKLGIQLKESEQGVKVLFVGENSNAQNAGILTNDVLLALGGKNIQGVDDLVTRLQTFEIGESVTLHLLRGMEEMDVDVLLRKITP
jgi:S1-C subfamily serine protease